MKKDLKKVLSSKKKIKSKSFIIGFSVASLGIITTSIVLPITLINQNGAIDKDQDNSAPTPPPSDLVSKPNEFIEITPKWEFWDSIIYSHTKPQLDKARTMPNDPYVISHFKYANPFWYLLDFYKDDFFSALLMVVKKKIYL